jgi:hypothetical protein
MMTNAPDQNYYPPAAKRGEKPHNANSGILAMQKAAIPFGRSFAVCAAQDDRVGNPRISPNDI